MFLFWPLLLSYTVVAINGYLDSFWVSILGAQATSAVNAMMDIYLIIASVGAEMGVACAVAISFQLGKDDADRVHVLDLPCDPPMFHIGDCRRLTDVHSDRSDGTDHGDTEPQRTVHAIYPASDHM